MTSSSSSSEFDTGDFSEVTCDLLMTDTVEASDPQSSDQDSWDCYDLSQYSGSDHSVITMEKEDGHSMEKMDRKDQIIKREEMVITLEKEDAHTMEQMDQKDQIIKRLDVGRLQHGCVHYRRRCRIRAPCCNEIFDCRHCHNEATIDMHELPRHEVETVICSLCNVEQQAGQICVHCGVQMGEYYCGKCKFWDDDVTKEQYHCDGCGICRTGGDTNFFHCQCCGCCYANVLKDKHPCVERAMHHNCPICFEFLFESTKDICVMQCGHTIHGDCLKEMQVHFQFACPVCSKSIYDMSSYWKKLDKELAAMPMPELYQNKMVWILCNDCGAKSETQFHVLGKKCLSCKSYNTRQIKSCAAAHPCSSRDK